MKAVILAAALAALSCSALAGAARETTQTGASLESPATTVVADASRLGSASLTALDASHWSPSQDRGTTGGEPLGLLMADIDAGTLMLVLGALGLALARPLGRALQRHERQRRAAALASTLGGSTARR